MCDHSADVGGREAAMVVIQEGVSGSEDPSDGAIWCDPCLVPLVRALNTGGLPTVASCCGHGHRPGSISLADDTHLLIAPNDEWADALGDFIHDRVGCKPGRECSACAAKWPTCATYSNLGCQCRGGLAPSTATCIRKRTGDLSPVPETGHQ